MFATLVGNDPSESIVASTKLRKLKDGDHCDVIAGTHAGKSGPVEDIKTSKTGHVTITVRQANDVRLKTLARNVVVRKRPGK